MVDDRRCFHISADIRVVVYQSVGAPNRIERTRLGNPLGQLSPRLRAA